MDPQSPPKRMTRARAAAKTIDPSAKSTRVITAAAKAKTARTTAPTTTTTRPAIKRKSPCDEDENAEHEEAPIKKMPAVDGKPTRGRGRPRKVAVEAPEKEVMLKPPDPRGRPRKIVEPAAEPAKATRTTRTNKSVSEETKSLAEPIKKATRGRSALTASTMASTSRSLAKPPVKKTVKFEEPEKENIAPATKPALKSAMKAPAPATTTGLRGKPTRKATTTTTSTRTGRNTKTAATSAGPNEKVEKPMPLSPKKVNQLTLNRVESDDELGMDEKSPVRRFKKAPIKPTSGTKSSSVGKVPVSGPENDENAVGIHMPEPELNFLMATPAKRLPPSPWKGSMRSPARRVEGLLVASVTTQIDQPTSLAPVKLGLLQSPAKRQPLNLNPFGTDFNGTSVSPVKLSFMSSPAKRPISPIKPLPRLIPEEESVDQSPAPKPTLLASPLPRVSAHVEEDEAPVDEDEEMEEGDNFAIPESPTRLSFPWSVVGRSAQSRRPDIDAPCEHSPRAEVKDVSAEGGSEENDDVEVLGEPMVVDNQASEEAVVKSRRTTPPPSCPKTVNPMFGLRERDLNPYDCADSESDDETPVKQDKFTSAFSALPATPCPASAKTRSRMQSVSRSTPKRRESTNNFGFTPLAQQLNGWSAGPSPLKANMGSALASTSFAVGEVQEQSAPIGIKAPSTSTESAQNNFFEDEMHVRPERIGDEDEEAVTDPEDNDDTILEDASFNEEDIALAAEANEMCLDAGNQDNDNDDTISETSQEYADENAIPIDPTLFVRNTYASAGPPVTPQRVIRREVHTVAKVPLKPADDSTPRPRIATRSYSASRVPVARPTERMTRNATVISYSPTRGGEDIWSSIGTPARTPRRDLNPDLLRGAVVFVDVHTSEGADASSIFVELLTQMGARCVKTWSWNPNNSSEFGGDPRVGITHVVYKDGGKRTLEKVRESAGVVQCVGVSWVLDCERENQWLDETPYYIDTAVVPRGGARRRKSMEPRAIANMNGMLVPSPVRNSSRGNQTAPSTPANNRRASALWIRTPDDSHNDDADRNGSDNSDNDSDDDIANDPDWSAPSPPPEAIARFAANVTPGPATPSSVGSNDQDDENDEDDIESRRQAMLMRTCPPKRTTFVELGKEILSKEKDERVLMRLMAARRKSLQFAPKIGSPLAKAWKVWN
ncbi:hypothetical protein N0V88_003887 [Collariella sp. IMI 366227]|nr:hypothetical protein N0V88_003887 [Collariella sp. IMI 366227]